MSDEHELYAAILAEPNDPALRRALAAHYDGKGDPHGELIRVQLELADKKARGERDPKLLRREDELVKAHGRAWAAPLDDLI
ncbi:MAG TPA: TIGR02996 domain-containing protein, partial [Kofleriaceae bacterium]|nr:TIGR02996 domain-containing protein [Kofleriaceae bacterium]